MSLREVSLRLGGGTVPTSSTTYTDRVRVAYAEALRARRIAAPRSRMGRTIVDARWDWCRRFCGRPGQSWPSRYSPTGTQSRSPSCRDIAAAASRHGSEPDPASRSSAYPIPRIFAVACVCSYPPALRRARCTGRATRHSRRASARRSRRNHRRRARRRHVKTSESRLPWAVVAG